MWFTAGPIASSVGTLAGSPGAGGPDGPNWTAGLHAPRSVDGTTPEITPPAAGGGYASADPDDFRELKSWGLVERPMAAVEEFSPEHEQRRAENERHRRGRREQEQNVSEAVLEDTQAYYRSTERPTDRTKWEYLKRHKAWFHPPVG